MSVLISTKSKQDTGKNKQIYEVWTFSGNEQKICFSTKLHALNTISNLYDKNIELYKDFIFCENIYFNEKMQFIK